MTPKLLGKGGKEKNEWGKYRFNISKAGQYALTKKPGDYPPQIH